ncbi:HAD family hydrolase [Murimonas intestini]|uniref:Phosphoglycolate phosphatase n=1 Tax=Murimonas intestini TaxID=1337051 RepID=A0AB73T3W1_9FIRM|nr:HAD family hydrolase [Murimonas intestini]MCR1841099.1 HAD family hydrolase [Murimonas intestini]MCR1865783.1 HAD family hydrolase [Murimonas intestini]MCR1883203.1 HAD family hydrolase [Murimonas intestini]
MLNKQVFLFDLDGTLTDPEMGITNSVAYALEYYGIHVEERKTLHPFIGPPLRDSFQKYYNFSEEQAGEAVWKYREYFSTKGLFENEVYEGIASMLKKLKDAGRTLIVATSKPTVYSGQILEHFGLSEYFDDIQGSCLDGTRDAKDEVIAYALEQNCVTDLDSAVMIGDRCYDIAGAKKCGLESIGVLYGYGDRQELESAGADHIVNTVAELEKLLLE